MAKVKIGIIGAGSICHAHLNAYKNVPDAEIVAICDINKDTLNRTADEYDIKRRYLSVSEMIADNPDLDAADVCTWNTAHSVCAIEALNAGLNVLSEKPMAYSVEEAEKMLEAAKRNNKLLMIGFVLRYSDDARVAMDFINNGYLGDIYYSKVQYVRRHGSPGGWFINKEVSGGGPVIDLGVHVIDLTRYLMGNPKPVSVYAMTSNRLKNRPNLKNGAAWTADVVSDADVSTVEDLGVAMIRYDNGATTLLETSYEIQGPDVYKRQVFGEKGGLDLSDGVTLYTDVNNYLSEVKIKTDDYKGAKEMFTAEMSHFVDCVANGTPCRSTAEDGLAVMRILKAIYESAETGHEVVL